jgi:hypothetical protein
LKIGVQQAEKLSLEQIRAFSEAGEEVHLKARAAKDLQLDQPHVAGAWLSAAKPRESRLIAALCREADGIEPRASDAADWPLCCGNGNRS